GVWNPPESAALRRYFRNPRARLRARGRDERTEEIRRAAVSRSHRHSLPEPASGPPCRLIRQPVLDSTVGRSTRQFNPCRRARGVLFLPVPAFAYGGLKALFRHG